MTAMGAIKVKISGDGARMTRNSNYIIVILNSPKGRRIDVIKRYMYSNK